MPTSDNQERAVTADRQGLMAQSTSPQMVPLEQAQAAINVMYDRCRELVAKPHPLMPTVDYFDYTLGTTSHVYSVQGFKETLDDLREARADLERFREALRVIAEGEYPSALTAAKYATRTLDRARRVPSLEPETPATAPLRGSVGLVGHGTCDSCGTCHACGERPDWCES